jgi:pyruvate/2-oxoglutarate dehydrogenase complex dihydrolipoamide dehydrogenase (E3) component
MGGGYIAVELGYFFEAVGTDVTIVEMVDSLVPREDGDVAEAFARIAADRHDVYAGHRVTAVEGSEVLVALGRRPNSDTLDRGFVKVLATPDGELLGAHAIGYEVSTLLHEAVVAMRTGATVDDVAGAITHTRR